jgi:predicted deacetylase
MDWKQFIVNFHIVTKAAAEEEIRAGLEIFQAIKIEFEVFIPTAWKLNEESIDVFEKLGFIFSEMQKDFCYSKLNPMKRLKL